MEAFDRPFTVAKDLCQEAGCAIHFKYQKRSQWLGGTWGGICMLR